MDGWNTSFLLGWPIFRCYVSLRECTSWFLVLSLLLCHQDIHAVLAYRLYGPGWALVMTDTVLTSSVRGSEKKRGQLPGWEIGVYPAPVEVGSLIIVYTIFRGFIHPWWLFRISSINSIRKGYERIQYHSCFSEGLKKSSKGQLIQRSYHFGGLSIGHQVDGNYVLVSSNCLVMVCENIADQWTKRFFFEFSFFGQRILMGHWCALYQGWFRWQGSHCLQLAGSRLWQCTCSSLSLIGQPTELCHPSRWQNKSSSGANRPGN